MITPENISKTDLTELLKEKTEKKPDNNVVNNTTEKQEEKKPVANPDDFSKPEVKQPEQVATEETLKAPDVNAPKKPISFSNAEEQAALIIDFIDGIDTLTLPSLYRKSIFDPGEIEKIKPLKAKVAEAETDKTITFTYDELDLWDRRTDYNDLVDEIPFSEGEIKTLKGPLARLIQKKNWELSAETALIGAALIVMTPRLLPLFNRIERKL
jgi:hypothetical protein